MKNIAEEYARRVWDNKDLSAIDDFIHPNIIVHSLLGSFQGPEQMRKVVKAWLNGFPDLHVRNLAVIGDQDLVAIHWKAQGTHKGEFKGIQPTGKPVLYAGVTIYRVDDNKIVEYWAYLDMNHLLQQIK